MCMIIINISVRMEPLWTILEAWPAFYPAQANWRIRFCPTWPRIQPEEKTDKEKSFLSDVKWTISNPVVLPVYIYTSCSEYPRASMVRTLCKNNRGWIPTRPLPRMCLATQALGAMLTDSWTEKTGVSLNQTPARSPSKPTARLSNMRDID